MTSYEDTVIPNISGYANASIKDFGMDVRLGKAVIDNPKRLMDHLLVAAQVKIIGTPGIESLEIGGHPARIYGMVRRGGFRQAGYIARGILFQILAI